MSGIDSTWSFSEEDRLIYIEHRKNKVEELKAIPKNHGCEIDLRSDVQRIGKMHVSHNPWEIGDDFDQWIDEFHRCSVQGPLILNTKEDGLEELLFQAMKKHSISEFLFLDTAFPTLVRYLQQGLGAHFMLRISSFEQYQNMDLFAGRIEWLWLDCFQRKPLDLQMVLSLKKMGFKLCLVSPELQGGQVEEFESFLSLAEICDSICTKKYSEWHKRLPSSGGF